MDLNDAQIQSFLRLGYFFGYGPQRYPADLSRIDKAAYAQVPKRELIALGKHKLRESFEVLFQPGRSREQVIPLSGGLDSRLILACLLEFTEARNIHTFTYGVPGSYDYDLGCRVAREAGTRHATYSLDSLTYHEDELLESSVQSHSQSILFHAPPLRELLRRYSESIIWSGYIGDLVAGSHLHKKPSSTAEEAKLRHLRGRAFVRSTKLYTWEDSAFLPFIAGGDSDPHRLTRDEQVTFAEVFRLIEPIVLMPGLEYRTPLINTPWMDFMLSVPNEFRFGEALMIEIACAAFPKLFGLPTKTTRGLPLGAHPMLVKLKQQSDRVLKVAHRLFPSIRYPCLIYDDFNEAIRQRRDAREIVLGNVERLKQRGVVPWVDFDGLRRNHLSRLRNHGDALITLASLELNLRARERSTSPA
jgi:Asparagine synthase